MGDEGTPDGFADGQRRPGIPTESVSREHALRRIKERLDLALSAAKLGLWDWQLPTDEVIFNEQWANMLGYTLADIDPELSAWTERVHPDDGSALRETLDSVRRGETVEFESEHRLRANTDDWVWVRTTGEVVEATDDGMPIRVIGIQENITVQRAHRKRLERQRDRMATFFESAGTIMLLLDRNGRIRRINDRGREILGYERGAAVGREGLGAVEPDGPGLDALFEELQSRETPAYMTHEGTVQARDGTWRTVRWRKTLVSDDRSDGPELLCSGIDVTELHEKNERLEKFASRLSHELRNSLSVLQCRLGRTADRAGSAEYDGVTRSLNRMERLVSDMLVLARHGDVSIEPVPLDLDTMALSCWEAVRSTRTELETDVSATVLADEHRLQQILENLFRNAVEHTPAGTTVEVGRHRDGFYIADDGAGIPADRRPEVLDTDTDLRHGAGHGLPVVLELVEAHGWELSLSTSDDGGLRVEITGVERV